ncbi:MAG: response regulator [Acidobacteria bacterium]|nr:response regulator [Acidobacteriota bacterium]
MMSDKVNILVVDDNPADRTAVQAVLERPEYYIETADSGEAALRCLMQQDFALILLDASMPLMDGFETARCIKQRTKSREIPIIFLTGVLLEQANAFEGYATGAVDYIHKPINSFVLKSKVAVFAELQRGRQELARWNRFLEARVAERTEALRESEERYRSLVEQAVFGICRATLDGKLLLIANSALAAMLGYASADELLAARSAGELFHDPDEHARLAEGLRQSGQVEGFETEWRREDGARVPVRISGRLHVPEMVELIVEDLSKRRSLEEQLRQAQKMESVGRLAGGVAHDFNNLLTVILGYADTILARLEPKDPSYAAAEEVRKAGERAAALTRQLLAFSRKQVLQARVLDLNTLIQEAAKMLRRLIGEDIELITNFDPSLGSVKADPGQIEQILVNLAVNARDAMPGVGKLVIETGNQPGSQVMLTVKDNGTGMDAETQSHLFEPFFTTKEQGRGTGLGLSTVYGIVQQSGGSIAVESAPGLGSTFRIYLPCVDEPVRKAETSIWAPESQRGSETVLVVEDEDMVRKLVCRVLSSYGYQILEAADAHEALRICEGEEGRIQAVVTDMIMPQMTGRDLARELTRLRPGLKVVFMSGYPGGPEPLDEDMVIVQKPFAPETLARKLREAMDAPV